MDAKFLSNTLLTIFCVLFLFKSLDVIEFIISECIEIIAEPTHPVSKVTGLMAHQRTMSSSSWIGCMQALAGTSIVCAFRIQHWQVWGKQTAHE